MSSTRKDRGVTVSSDNAHTRASGAAPNGGGSRVAPRTSCPEATGKKSTGDDPAAGALRWTSPSYPRRPDHYHRLVADNEDKDKDLPDSSADASTDLSGDVPAEPAVSPVPQKVARTSSPLTPITLVIALIAVGLAVWALARTPEEPSAAQGAEPGDAAQGAEPGDAAQGAQPGGAKQRVCDSAQVVAVAVQLQTNTTLGSDPAAVEAVAANARLAMLGGGDYLLSQIENGTPADLADAARSFGTTLRVIGINALAGLPNSDPAQDGRLRDAERIRDTLAELCTR